MTNEGNAQTCRVLSNEIKTLQTRCEELCYIIDNNECMNTRSSHNANEKKLCYMDSLTKNIQNDETPIIIDFNVNTSQFLSEIKEKIIQVGELTAFTEAAVKDMNSENNRLRAGIKIVQEAKSRPWTARQEVQPEHLQRAKHRFKTLKAELHGLLHSLFPGSSEAISGILAELARERTNETSSGYIQITPENYRLIELLSDMNIVTPNPYNKMEVKLAI